VQTLVDCGLGDISSSHLQLLLRPVTDMRTVPHLAAQPGQQNVCKRHSERRPPAGSPLAERLHWALQHGPSRARTSRALCADHRGERSCASRWRRSFHCLFKVECTAQRTIVDSIHFSMIAYVDDVYLVAISRKWRVRNGRRIHLVRTCHQ
jgi:hypothetical protein